MRKPRNFDSELKTLDERARQIKGRKLQQLGELVVATGADALPIDVLTGALLIAAEANDTTTKEGWRARGAAFFQKPKRKKRSSVASADRAPQSGSGTLPPTSGEGTQ